MFFRRYIAEHRSRHASRSLPRRWPTCDVVVAGCDICNKRAEHVERCAVAQFHFFFYLLLDLVHRHMAGAFDHHLHVGFPSLAASARRASSTLQTAPRRTHRQHEPGPQAIAERVAHVVLRHDLRDAVKVLIQEVLLVMRGHPLRQDGAAAAHNAGDALCNHRHVLDQHARHGS